ncbi:MAG TPA: hypothetical protein VJ839_08295 [Candidatus Limnocylindria bacterium]|nr:hypothetical protein [Candidatus Limnocylindria bacterium]
MCLAVGCLFIFGPRAAIIIWWLVEQLRWAATFDNAIVPILGFLFLPWTTLMYVLVAPQGLDTIDTIGMILAVLADIGSLFGGGWQQRDRLPGYGSPASPP